MRRQEQSPEARSEKEGSRPDLEQCWQATLRRKSECPAASHDQQKQQA